MPRPFLLTVFEFNYSNARFRQRAYRLVAPEAVLTTIYRLKPETLEVALSPLRLVGLSMVFEAVGTVLQNALLGAGDTRRVMLTTNRQSVAAVAARRLSGRSVRRSRADRVVGLAGRLTQSAGAAHRRLLAWSALGEHQDLNPRQRS